jgi:hypothetical protein
MKYDRDRNAVVADADNVDGCVAKSVENAKNLWKIQGMHLGWQNQTQEKNILLWRRVAGAAGLNDDPEHKLKHKWHMFKITFLNLRITMA